MRPRAIPILNAAATVIPVNRLAKIVDFLAEYDINRPDQEAIARISRNERLLEVSMLSWLC